MSGHRTFKDTLLGQESEHNNLVDPGASGRITPIGSPQVVEIVTAAAEARSLTDPSAVGQILTLILKTDGGDATVTADSAMDQSGNTIMTFADAGDQITLIGIRNGANYEWRPIAGLGSEGGVALS